jgi:hypothetical protein
MVLSDKIFIRNENIAWRVIGDEALLVNPKDSLIYPLNSVGTRIWESLDGKNSCRDISNVIGEEFTGDKANLEVEVSVFIGDMVEKGLARSV